MRSVSGALEYVAALQRETVMRAEMDSLQDEKLVLQGKVEALHEVIAGFAREHARFVELNDNNG